MSLNIPLTDVDREWLVKMIVGQLEVRYLTPNSVVMFLYPKAFFEEEDYRGKIIKEVERNLSEEYPNITFMGIPSNTDIRTGVEFVPESHLNSLGWFRKV
jgi:hypothetical protein